MRHGFGRDGPSGPGFGKMILDSRGVMKRHVTWRIWDREKRTTTSCHATTTCRKGRRQVRPDAPPTLSVGVVIGHHKFALSDMLRLSQEAEHLAKGPKRAGFCVLYPAGSGGSPIRIEGRWKDGLDSRLEQYMAWFRAEELPDRFAYDLHQMANFYSGWRVPPKPEWLQKDAARLAAHKARMGDDKARAVVCVAGVSTVKDLNRRATELLLARHMEALIGPRLVRSSQREDALS